MKILFFILLLSGVIGLAFPYVGYPLILKIMPRRRKPEKEPLANRPALSIIVPVYNGAEFIEEKIRNIYAQNYPGKYEIIVVSDASDDGSDELASNMDGFGDRLKLIRLPERKGKSLAQNQAVKEATGEILIHTDAAVLLDEGALERIADEFRDPTVGCVTGEDASIALDTQDRSAGAGIYSRFEVWLRRLEVEKTGTLLGVSGCLFGVRRFLRPDVPETAVDDLYVPLHVVSRGFRVVIAEGAVAFVKRTEGLQSEFLRKVRTFTGALFSICESFKNEKPEGLRRVRLQLGAHKILRWSAPVFAGFALAGAVGLSRTHWVFFSILSVQIFCYWLGIAGLIAAAGWMGKKRRPASGMSKIFGKASRLAAFYVIILTSLTAAWIRWIFRRPYVTWTPTKRN